MLEIDELRSRVIMGSSPGCFSLRKREILREEEPALTERIRPGLRRRRWFAMAVVTKYTDRTREPREQEHDGVTGSQGDNHDIKFKPPLNIYPTSKVSIPPLYDPTSLKSSLCQDNRLHRPTRRQTRLCSQIHCSTSVFSSTTNMFYPSTNSTQSISSGALQTISLQVRAAGINWGNSFFTKLLFLSYDFPEIECPA